MSALAQDMGRASTGKNKADLAQREELEVILLAYSCTDGYSRGCPNSSSYPVCHHLKDRIWDQDQNKSQHREQDFRSQSAEAVMT